MSPVISILEAVKHIHVYMGLPSGKPGLSEVGPVGKEIKSPLVYTLDDARDIQVLAALERLVEL